MGSSTTDALGALALSDDALRAVGMLDFLESDRRPTFVIDLEVSTYSKGPLQPAFYNVALKTYKDLYTALTAEFTPDSYQSSANRIGGTFANWASKIHNYQSVEYSPITFHSLAWDVVTVNSRWNIISAHLSTRQHRRTIVQTQAAHRKRKSEVCACF